jgi:hypothetical protein
MQQDFTTTCPICGALINVSSHLQHVLDAQEDKTLPSSLYASLWCNQCGKGTVALFLQPENTVDNHTKSNLLEQLLKDVTNPPKVD